MAARAGAKTADYWWTVLFTDPLAVPLVRFLTRHRWLSPNGVSVLALLLGASVGPVLAGGSRTGAIVGGVLFYLAFLMDCVDGKLARALGTTSKLGAVLDGVGDATRRASASAGLLVWLVRYEGTLRALVIGAVYVALAYLFTEISGGSELRRAAFEVDAPGPSRPAEGGRKTLADRRLLPNPGMPDVQAVAFILGPITGLVLPALLVAIAMLVAGCAIALRRHLRGS